MQKTKMKHSRALALVLLVLLMIELFLFSFTATIHAEGSSDEIQYTNAYNDLNASGAFKPEDYPQLSKSDAGYYSLSVITIAESENGELFVYVYQPCADAEEPLATSINISTSVRTKNKFKNYTLTYINSYSVFYKYKVDSLTVSSDAERHYEIPSIFRAWNAVYGDAGADKVDNTISEISFPVGKQFVFKTAKDGSTSATMQDVEYIKIENKYVGYIRYTGDMLLPEFLSKSSTDSHFVAFSTDREIDELLEADVYFTTQDYYYYDYDTVYQEKPWGAQEPAYKYLDYEQKAECGVADGNIFVKSEHVFDRIQKTSEFLESKSAKSSLFSFPGFNNDVDVKFTTEATEALKSTEWVLNFVETDYFYHIDPSSGNLDHSFTRVGDVSILRLKYITDGITYDLGVVDNKQTGSEDPAGETEEQPWWQKIMMLLCFILLATVATPFISPLITVFFGIIGSGIKTIIKILWRILTLPLRLIFGRRRY